MSPTASVQTAYERLYSEHWKDAVRQARIILRGQSDPADVAATAFALLWAEITEGRSDGLRERLIELTRTAAATEAKREQRELSYLGYPMDVIGMTDADTLDDLYVRTVREGGTHAPDLAALTVPPPTPESYRFGVELDAAVRSLTKPQREAFVLTELRGLSTVEAASVLGISRPALAERRNRALESVRDSLKGSA